jgi:uncharacterized protein (TIGR00299 family) protein
MTKLVYLECPTGIAGDMCLGALIHAGVPLEYLIEKLKRLGIADEYKLWAELVHRNGQQATQVHVDLISDAIEAQDSADGFSSSPSVASHQHRSEAIRRDHDQVHGSHSHPHMHPHTEEHHPVHHTHPSGSVHPQAGRNLPEIEQLIRSAGLPTQATAWSLAVFRRLAEAEGAVHGIAPEQVHFHEVGATDAIVDIVGTCLGLDWLAIDRLYCSALPIGGGTVWAAHGRLPVPAPAVLKLWELRQVPIYSNGIERELVTPTGAAIVTTLATEFGTPPAMILQKVGLGAGCRDLPIPNILRLWLGEAHAAAGKRHHQHSDRNLIGAAPLAASTADPAQETVSVLETQVDDLNPQAIGYVIDALLTAGALDVLTQAVGMKKSRPGILLTVICHPDQAKVCEMVLFQETTTLGVRHSTQQRTILHRYIESVETPYGMVRVKVARSQPNGTLMNVQPEYEDCAKLARQTHLAWREIHRVALQSWYQHTDLSEREATAIDA